MVGRGWKGGGTPWSCASGRARLSVYVQATKGGYSRTQHPTLTPTHPKNGGSARASARAWTWFSLGNTPF